LSRNPLALAVRSAKAGLLFPVGRIARFLKKGKYALLPRRRQI
jgi:hypothetical protein